jgi:hypothetical protein
MFLNERVNFIPPGNFSPRGKLMLQKNWPQFLYNMSSPLRVNFGTRVAIFFLVQNAKSGKNIPNGQKIFPIAIK